MELIKRSFAKWIEAAIILVVGILCIVAGALWGESGAQDAIDGISITLGVVLLIVGGLALVLAIVMGILAKKGFAGAAIPAGFLVAIGISLIAVKYAGSFIVLFLYVLPYILIVLGTIILADGIFNLVMAFMKKGAKIAPIVSIVLGAVTLVLGCLCIGNNPVIPTNVQLIVFGIIVVLYAALIVVSTFIKLPDAVVVVVKEKGEEKEEKKEEAAQ